MHATTSTHHRPRTQPTAPRRHLLHLPLARPCRPPSLLLFAQQQQQPRSPSAASAAASPSASSSASSLQPLRRPTATTAATTTTLTTVTFTRQQEATDLTAAASAGAARLEALLFSRRQRQRQRQRQCQPQSFLNPSLPRRALAFTSTPALAADPEQCYSALALVGDAALGVLQAEASVVAAAGGLNDGGGGGAAAGTAGAGGAGTAAIVALSRAYLALTAEAWGLREMIYPAPLMTMQQEGSDRLASSSSSPSSLVEWRRRLGHAALAEVLEAVVGAVAVDDDDDDDDDLDSSAESSAARGYARVRLVFGAWMAASYEAVRAAHLRAQAAALRRAADEAAAMAMEDDSNNSTSPSHDDIAQAARALELEAAAARRSALAAKKRSFLPVVDPIGFDEDQGLLLEGAVEAAVAQWRGRELAMLSESASESSSSSSRRSFGPSATAAACRRRVLGMLRLDAFLGGCLRSRGSARALRARARLQRRRRALARRGEGGDEEEEEDERWMWWRAWGVDDDEQASTDCWAPWPLGSGSNDHSSFRPEATLQLLLGSSSPSSVPAVAPLAAKLQAAFHRAAAPMNDRDEDDDDDSSTSTTTTTTTTPTSLAAFTSPSSAQRAALAALVVLASPAGAGAGAERGHTTCRPLAAAAKLRGLPSKAYDAVRGASALHSYGSAVIRLAAVCRAYWGADEAALLLTMVEEEEDEEDESSIGSSSSSSSDSDENSNSNNNNNTKPRPAATTTTTRTYSSRRRRAAATRSLAGRLTSAASSLCTTRHRCRMASTLIDPDDGWVPLDAPFRDARFKAQKSALSVALDAAVGALMADAGPRAAMALSGGLLARTSALRDGVDAWWPSWANKCTRSLKQRLRDKGGVVEGGGGRGGGGGEDGDERGGDGDGVVSCR